jgi:hypothetical protein
MFPRNVDGRVTRAGNRLDLLFGCDDGGSTFFQIVGGRVSPGRNRRDLLLFYPKDGDSVFLRNIGGRVSQGRNRLD